MFRSQRSATESTSIEKKETKHTTPKHLAAIPRVQSTAPRKNTIEWEIPEQVKVVSMLIEKVGYLALIKVAVEIRRWWHRSWQQYSAKSQNPDKP
jgi:hypothetical protein